MSDYKIYTRKGDQGTTSLVGGTRISKCHERIEAYGTVDELSAHIAVVHDSSDCDNDTKKMLIRIQECLFIIESSMATETTSEISKNIPQLKDDDIAFLENEIDRMNAQVPPLTKFVIPGGNLTASYCHVARTVCRRAERTAIHCLETGNHISEMNLKYLNRLSDYFFILARYIMHHSGKQEIFWNPQK
ncbi:MAG: cob(I)yrinic acid a,c-diamide adenosyltransferase [Lentimicrobiaceae bacterium]|nr:cob(I)yrinic acid a,c-diamide adenosyltransferase [Lentimicrobiaceae bacterium]